jgi:NAD(P)-dependent dehydrogenase (short-subunit alcohol dehydrogenase family)
MMTRKSGKIINIASIAGKLAARSMAGYSASKAAVIMLTRTMALEMTRHNIQVNVLLPGYFLTPFNIDFFQTDAGKNLIKKMIPLNRVGDVEGVAQFIAQRSGIISDLVGAAFVFCYFP